MGLFSRARAKRPETPSLADTAADVDERHEAGRDASDAPAAGASAADAAQGGAPVTRTEPLRALDRSEVEDASEYVDLGSLWVRGQGGMELRLELDEQQQQITGVTALLGESAVQLQAFAAPRTEGVWVEIRDEIAASIGEAGGTAEVVTREFGEELQTRMPQPGPDGRTVFMPARFVGIDGPRWFLRAVISGRAAVDPAAAEPITELIATTVVNRGDEAMPPRELLPLTLPDQGESEQAGPEEADGAVGTLDDLRPFERGPEITEVR